MNLTPKLIGLSVILCFGTLNAANVDKSMCTTHMNALNYAAFVEEACNINGNIKNELGKLFKDSSCANYINKAEWDASVRQTYDGLGARMKAIGGAKFCMESKVQYFGMYEDIKGRYAGPVKQAAPQPSPKAQQPMPFDIAKGMDSYDAARCQEYYIGVLAELISMNKEQKYIDGYSQMLQVTKYVVDVGITNQVASIQTYKGIGNEIRAQVLRMNKEDVLKAASACTPKFRALRQPMVDNGMMK